MCELHLKHNYSLYICNDYTSNMSSSVVLSRIINAFERSFLFVDVAFLVELDRDRDLFGIICREKIYAYKIILIIITYDFIIAIC